MTGGMVPEDKYIDATMAAEILGVSPRQAVHATADSAIAADRRTAALRETPPRVDETPQADAPRPSQPQEPRTPGHARPDDDDVGSETPEVPIEAFPDPSPNQPADPDPGWPPTGTPAGDMPKTAAVNQSTPAVVTRVVRVPVERQAGGVVGWLSERSGVRNNGDRHGGVAGAGGRDVDRLKEEDDGRTTATGRYPSACRWVGDNRMSVMRWERSLLGLRRGWAAYPERALRDL